MLKLVSIIIPCFNAQRWLAEAIDSCLNQTYPNIEIIVVDDGSTDNSIEILKRYQDRLTWETGANRGGNHARNRGFALSSGHYIQYLDADDYILPTKIEKQVQCLEATNADVVYGDWQYRHHPPNGTSYLSEVKICGPKSDFLESLLSNDRWVSPAAVLFTRNAVNQCGGWDETLKAAQDRDFLLTVAMSGATFFYQAGCESVYREYGKVTVSTSCKRRWLDSHCYVMKKAESQLTEQSRLTPNYRKALAKGYFDMGREYLYVDYPSLDNQKYQRYLEAVEQSLRLFPRFKVRDRNLVYNLVQGVFGCRTAEAVSYFVTKLKLSLQSFNTETQAKEKSAC
ncbi:glycosyltransferase [Oculatella sp. LEGE 06141]|uniref:glycosyltransferase n=1 Tax=Oculatella sp. LEGE 06141 TaxID=1828648 RepID=UPI00187FFBCC|nr:glycosyltransferase [Oculatella sp. LEGE 06141]MBE9182505.1 glycosyltransferase [Oculatella sp. LEGE 06141]